MDNFSADRLIERIEILERGSRRWRIVSLGAIPCIAVLILAGARQPKIPTREFFNVVECESLLLKDKLGGKVRIELTSTPEHPAGLTFYGNDGTPKVILGINPDDTGGLVCWDQRHQRRVSLGHSSDGVAKLELHGSERTLNAVLAVRPDNSGGLYLNDQDERPRVELKLRPDGGGALNLYDRLVKCRTAIASQADGRPSLAFYDHDGHSRLGMWLEENGAPDIRGMDPDGRSVFQLPGD